MEKHEVEQAIQIISDAILERDWVVGTGKDSAATRIDLVVALLEAEMDGVDERLVKTMRVCRDALLSVYRDVERREIACMLLCPCVRSEKHHRRAHYTAGCFTQESESGNRLGGRLWDVVEFLRQHHGYENARLVAQVVVGALKTLSSEFRHKEEHLIKAVEKTRGLAVNQPRVANVLFQAQPQGAVA